MELNDKEIGFVIQALDYRIGWYEQQLRRSDLTEDEHSELTNDMYYLRALVADMKRQWRGASTG